MSVMNLIRVLAFGARIALGSEQDLAPAGGMEQIRVNFFPTLHLQLLGSTGLATCQHHRMRLAILLGRLRKEHNNETLGHL